MIVHCPGCSRHIGVGLPHAGDVFEQMEGLRILAGSKCSKKECDALKHFVRLERQCADALSSDLEAIEANP